MALGAIFESLQSWQYLILFCIVVTIIIVAINTLYYEKTGKHLYPRHQWGWWLDEILEPEF